MSLGEQDTGLPMTGLFRRHTGFNVRCYVSVKVSTTRGFPRRACLDDTVSVLSFHFSLEVTTSLVSLFIARTCDWWNKSSFLWTADPIASLCCEIWLTSIWSI